MFSILITHIVPIFSALEDTTCNPDKTFFGLPVWYKYLNVQSDNCTFSGFSFFSGPNGVFAPDNIFLILLAILDDLLIIAGIVAVAFVIYGGIQFMLGQGEPDRIKKAQGTIINAFIGLAIAILGAAIVNFLGNALSA
jgi:hypothetical protein